MSIDIQVNVNLFQNPKVVKLRRRLGAEGVISLLQLWCHARLDHPDGNLGHISAEDLEIAAGWSGENDAFYNAIVELGLVDKLTDESMAIHDWDKHEPFSVTSVKRTEAGKKGAEARWQKMARQDLPSEKMRLPSTNTMANDSNAIFFDAPDQTRQDLPSEKMRLPSTNTMANDSNAIFFDAPDQTRPDQTNTNTPPPPSPGGECVAASSTPPEPGEQKLKSGEVDLKSGEQHPEDRPKKPKQEDPHGARVYEHYQSVIQPAHPGKRAQTIRNVVSLIKRLRLEVAHAHKSPDQIAEYLVACIERYRRSAAFSRATDPFHRYAASNFFGQADVWRAFASDDAPAMQIVPDLARPSSAAKHTDPFEAEAKRCAARNPGCVSGREKVCERCPNKNRANSPTWKLHDWTGSADRSESNRSSSIPNDHGRIRPDPWDDVIRRVSA